MPVNVTLKSLSELCDLLSAEERILKSRLSVERIMKLYSERRCHLYFKKRKVVGFAALWPTCRPDFFEFGTLWVRKDYRHQGISSAIFDSTMELAPKGSLIFLITKSAKVVHEAKKRKWDEAINWQTSPNWQKVCQPVGASREEACRSFSADCRMFYTID